MGRRLFPGLHGGVWPGGAVAGEGADARAAARAAGADGREATRRQKGEAMVGKAVRMGAAGCGGGGGWGGGGSHLGFAAPHASPDSLGGDSLASGGGSFTPAADATPLRGEEGDGDIDISGVAAATPSPFGAPDDDDDFFSSLGAAPPPAPRSRCHPTGHLPGESGRKSSSLPPVHPPNPPYHSPTPPHLYAPPPPTPSPTQPPPPHFPPSLSPSLPPPFPYPILPSPSPSIITRCGLGRVMYGKHHFNVFLKCNTQSTAAKLWQSIKQSAGPHAAPLLTRISFDGRSPQLDGQILTTNHKN